MFRLFAAAALLAAPALPALAQPSLNGTHVEAAGAAAGRSPHRAYRPIAATETCGRPGMHIPAGKGHVYGRHALPSAPCQPARVATAETTPLTGQE